VPLVQENTETEENDEEEKSSDSLGGASASHSQPYFKSAAENDKLLAKFWDISTYKLEYDDLNDCVAALLKKAKDDNSSSRDIKRRQRKNKDQLGILENEFFKNPDWQREFIRNISHKLGLRECQVYKWHWDQRKKAGLPVQRYTN
jgi:Homeodomain